MSTNSSKKASDSSIPTSIKTLNPIPGLDLGNKKPIQNLGKKTAAPAGVPIQIHDLLG